MQRNVPGPVLGLVALLGGLVVFSVVALYIYYPAPKEAFEEILRVRTEAITAVRTGHKEEAIRQIQHWDLLTRKLQVGVFIRTGKMDAETGKATEDLREGAWRICGTPCWRTTSTRQRELLAAVEEAYQEVPRLLPARRSARAEGGRVRTTPSASGRRRWQHHRRAGHPPQLPDRLHARNNWANTGSGRADSYFFSVAFAYADHEWSSAASKTNIE